MRRVIVLSLHHCRYQYIQHSLRLKIHEVKSLTAEQDGVEPVLITMATLAHQGGSSPGISPWCTVMAATSTVGGVILKLESESTGTMASDSEGYFNNLIPKSTAHLLHGMRWVM